MSLKMTHIIVDLDNRTKDTHNRADRFGRPQIRLSANYAVFEKSIGKNRYILNKIYLCCEKAYCLKTITVKCDGVIKSGYIKNLNYNVATRRFDIEYTVDLPLSEILNNISITQQLVVKYSSFSRFHDVK